MKNIFLYLSMLLFFVSTTYVMENDSTAIEMERGQPPANTPLHTSRPKCCCGKVSDWFAAPVFGSSWWSRGKVIFLSFGATSATVGAAMVIYCITQVKWLEVLLGGSLMQLGAAALTCSAITCDARPARYQDVP